MASLPRRNVPPPISITASGSNNAVMPVTSPAFSLATNNRSKSWGSLAGSLVVTSFIVTPIETLRQQIIHSDFHRDTPPTVVACSTFTEAYRRHAAGVKHH